MLTDILKMCFVALFGLGFDTLKNVLELEFGMDNTKSKDFSCLTLGPDHNLVPTPWVVVEKFPVCDGVDVPFPRGTTFIYADALNKQFRDSTFPFTDSNSIVHQILAQIYKDKEAFLSENELKDSLILVYSDQKKNDGIFG
ncbi:hypothetical protein L596_026893 [Steinernema carpocapsae]|uniref:Uncharacterized protein n=1 Tax=Steinernema carpocapsae TaxID=34508 RepID=A0A4U5M2P5_STECR|nr:hypothetical protein L596_026893 [Steinernema carpocapsae]